MSTRLLITGSRDWTNTLQMHEVLRMAYVNCGMVGGLPLVIVEGGARGADTVAHNWAMYMMSNGFRVKVETHRADWLKYGKSAGPIRNQAMVDLGADLCVAFYAKAPAANKGTGDCAGRAEKAGIKVKKYLES